MGVSSLEAIVIGIGCPNCRRLTRMTQEVLQELGAVHVPVRLEDPLSEEGDWGVVLTPALVLGGKLLVTGRMPSQRHLRKLMREALEETTPKNREEGSD